MCCPSLCENPLHGKFLLVFLFFDSKMSMDKNFHSALMRSKHQWDAHCDFCMPPVAIVFLMFCSKTKTGWQQVDSLTFKYFTYSNQNALCEVRKVYPFQIAVLVWSCGLVNVQHIRQTTSVLFRKTKAFELFPELVLISH